MLIHYLGDNIFSVKTRVAEIVMGKDARVDSIPLAGPGEYEVADIQIKGFHDAYLFSAEDLNLLYVNKPDGLSEETAKYIEEDIDVLMLTVDEDPEHIKKIAKTITDIDPKMALPALSTTDHPFCKEVGGCPTPIDELKLVKKDLVEGERKVVILHARSRSRS